MQGRKRIPTEVKRMTGTLRADRVNRREPVPSPADSEPPEFLDKEAKAKWRELFPCLSRLKIVSEADRDLFMLYCSAYSNWKLANDVLKKEKHVYKTPNGSFQQIPHVSMARGWMLLMTKIAAEMGIPAPMRSKIDAGPEESNEDKEYF